MDFKKFFLFFIAFFVMLSFATAAPAPAPKWKFWKKVEHVGQHIRDGIIKAGPAVAVVGSAASLGK